MSEQDEQTNDEFSDTEIEAMSDEERLALGVDDDPEDLPADEEPVEDLPAEEPELEVEPEAPPTPTEEAAPAPVAEEPPAEVEPPRDMQGELATIDEELAGLGQKYEDGDINAVELNTEQNRLNRERNDVSLDIRDANNSAKAAANQWETDVNDFIGADEGHKAVVSDPIVKQAFEAALRQAATSPEGLAANNEWRLNKAKSILAEKGISIGTTKPAAPPTDNKPESRKPTDTIPTDLGGAPAGGDNDSSEFSHLNNMEGLELEEALSKLSPEQEARYMEG